MPKGMGYGKGAMPGKMKSTPSVKPAYGNCGGPAKTTMASDAGNSGRSIQSGPFKKNPKQK